MKKKHDNLIKLLFATQLFSFPETFRKLLNIRVETRNVRVEGIFSWFPVLKYASNVTLGTATRSGMFFYLTCLHSTAFILLSISFTESDD